MESNVIARWAPLHAELTRPLGPTQLRPAVELVHDATWETRAAARPGLFEYIEVFYNAQRRHSPLGYLTPRAFERQRDYRAALTLRSSR